MQPTTQHTYSIAAYVGNDGTFWKYDSVYDRQTRYHKRQSKYEMYERSKFDQREHRLIFCGWFATHENKNELKDSRPCELIKLLDAEVMQFARIF